MNAGRDVVYSRNFSREVCCSLRLFGRSCEKMRSSRKEIAIERGKTLSTFAPKHQKQHVTAQEEVAKERDVSNFF